VRTRSILCPVDFSAVSRQAYDHALVWAARTGARLTLLHAVDPLLAEAASATHVAADDLRDTHAELRAFAGRPGVDLPAWAPAAAIAVTVGEPWREIVTVAAVHEADLIVMGTQGLGGVRLLAFGSTAEHVMRATSVPVLAVPPAAAQRFLIEPDGPHVEVGTVLAAIDFDAGSNALPATGAAIADELARTTARAALDSLAVRLDTLYPIDTAVVTGRSAEALTALAAIRGAGLLILGTASALSSHRPGSTARRLLSLTEIPVLAVPPVPAHSADRQPLAAGRSEVW